MFRNYLKIALRNSLKHKGFSLINILGLAIGMAGCLLILLYVQHELGYDDFHRKGDRIYRLNKVVVQESGERVHTAEMPGNFAPTLRRDYPDVENVVRLRPWWSEMLVGHGEKRLKIPQVVFTDSTFFRVFDFQLLRGDRDRVLREPLTAVITEEVARQFFGEADPIGKVLEGIFEMPLTVSGIARRPPANSHIQFDMLIAWSTSTHSAYAERLDWMNRWITQAVFSYVLLRPGADPGTLEAGFPAFMHQYMSRWEAKYFPYLQPLDEIHLHSADIAFSAQMNPNAGNIVAVYILAIIAGLILVIACINYMNLATARATRRAREVGLRKTLGAGKRQLMLQFIGESFILTLAALMIALVLTELSINLFNQLTQRALVFDPLRNPALLAGMLGITLFVGLAAGSYPALILSAFRPVQTLKGIVSSRAGGALSRKLLVTAQFCFSIFLMAATIVVYQQQQYLREKNLGFQQEQVVLLDIPRSTIREKVHTFKNELLKHPEILSAAVASGGPGIGAMGFDVLPEGLPPTGRFAVPTVGVDFDFAQTYGMEIAAGRDFNPDLAGDSAGVLINETLAKQLGWDSPLGKRLALGTDDPMELTVIGVVKDFHLRSLHQKIEPVLLYITARRFNHLAVRLSGRHIPETLQHIDAAWKRFENKYPFEYRFLDQVFAKYYLAEARLTRALGIFAALAIGIACLGLFGLAAYTAEQRTREIGVRKVLGATAAGIVVLLSREFIKLVLIANLVAVPAAYFALKIWLQDFPYRVAIGWPVFALAGGLALLIALLTVIWQALRAARTNPVKALRYE